MSFLVTVGVQLPPKLGSSFLHPPKLKMSDRQKILKLKSDLKEDKCSTRLHLRSLEYHKNVQRDSDNCKCWFQNVTVFIQSSHIKKHK